MILAARPCLIRVAAWALVAAAGPAGGAAAQDQVPRNASRIEAIQIDTAPQDASDDHRAFLEPAGTPRPAAVPRESLTRAEDGGIQRGPANAPANQISTPAQSDASMGQLSAADLEATLAQLSPAERQVLLQAIEGTDICDAPPDIAAILALCRTRLETRSGEFAAAAPQAPLSAEENLLRGNLETTALPGLAQVIARLARGGAAADDRGNQEIAAVALAVQQNGPADRRPQEDPGIPALGADTQALINSLINQLGGQAP